MKNQTMIFTVIVTISLFGAFTSTFAQEGVGAKYGARDPQVCKDKSQPKNGAISAAQAKEYVICDTEHAIEDLYFAEDVTVQVGAARRYNPSEDINFPDIDIKFPIYSIRGSLKKYRCNSIYLDRSNLGRNCAIYNEPNAKGACYKDTFGDWNCGMTDTKTGDYIAENVPPPGGTKPTKTKTDNKKDEQKDNPPKKDAEKTENKTENENRDKNGFPKPDFSAISNYYELVKYEYDSPPGWLTLTVKVKKETSPVTSNFSIHFLDEDGAEVIAVQPVLGGWGNQGDVLHSKVAIPNANDMKKVKKVVLRR